jgi:hypothetical protein
MSPSRSFLDALRSLSLPRWLHLFSLTFGGLSALTLLLGILALVDGLVRGVSALLGPSPGAGGMLSLLPGLSVLLVAVGLGAVAVLLQGLRRTIRLLERLVDAVEDPA